MARGEIIESLREALDIERERAKELLGLLVGTQSGTEDESEPVNTLSHGWKAQQLRIARRERERDLEALHGKD